MMKELLSSDGRRGGSFRRAAAASVSAAAVAVLRVSCLLPGVPGSGLRGNTGCHEHNLRTGTTACKKNSRGLLVLYARVCLRVPWHLRQLLQCIKRLALDAATAVLTCIAGGLHAALLACFDDVIPKPLRATLTPTEPGAPSQPRNHLAVVSTTQLLAKSSSRSVDAAVTRRCCKFGNMAAPKLLPFSPHSLLPQLAPCFPPAVLTRGAQLLLCGQFEMRQ